MNNLQRVVTLGAELPEIFDALDLASSVVGVSGFTRRPFWARALPKVGGFTTLKLNAIRELNPDLVIATSHLQHQTVDALVSDGYSVLALNPVSLQDISDMIRLMGRLFWRDDQARIVAAAFDDAVRASPPIRPQRPRVHFEEWGDPIMGPIPWVAELLTLAGAELAFPEIAEEPMAKNRIVTTQDIVQRKPDLIVASWCGRRVDLASIARRPGFDQFLPDRILAVPSDLFLQPGLSLIDARRQLDLILNQSF